MVPLAGADTVVGLGMLRASTLLVPEQIIFDDEIYHTNRRLAEGIDLGAENLPLDLIQTVGPGGHYLAQKHTRRKVRELWIPELTHPAPFLGTEDLPDIQGRARAELDRILAEHEPEPLDPAVQAELKAILEAAAQDIGN
jgi:trimethylamine--corrinoid protein Co-methyltransferase